MTITYGLSFSISDGVTRGMLGYPFHMEGLYNQDIKLVLADPLHVTGAVSQRYFISPMDSFPHNAYSQSRSKSYGNKKMVFG